MTKIQHVKDVETPLVVGEKYIVTCITPGPYVPIERCFPIIGNIHSDDELAAGGNKEASKRHIHLDVRFIFDDVFKEFNFINEQFAYFIDVDTITINDFLQGHTKDLILECRRQYSYINPTLMPYRDLFEDQYAHCKVDCNICPHRKTDLSNIKPITINGKLVKVCPLHLLTWSCETGKMVKREMKEKVEF